MRLTLDTCVGLESPLHRWWPRAKLVGLGILMLGFASVQQIQLVPICLLVTALLYVLSVLPGSFLRSRLRYPGLFLLGMVVALPLLSGSTILWRWGPLAIRQEGLLSMGLISGRFLSIVTVGMLLLGTTSLLALIDTLVSLGLPPLIAEMALLAYRYLFDMADRLDNLRQAMRLRGFHPRGNKQSWQQLAAVTGTLKVLSYEQMLMRILNMNLETAQIVHKRLCSFCKKTQQQVNILVAGPDCYICDACIDICNSIVLEHRKASNDEETVSVTKM